MKAGASEAHSWQKCVSRRSRSFEGETSHVASVEQVQFHSLKEVKLKVWLCHWSVFWNPKPLTASISGWRLWFRYYKSWKVAFTYSGTVLISVPVVVCLKKVQIGPKRSKKSLINVIAKHCFGIPKSDLSTTYYATGSLVFATSNSYVHDMHRDFLSQGNARQTSLWKNWVDFCYSQG